MYFAIPNRSTGAFGLLLTAIFLVSTGCAHDRTCRHDCRSCNDIAPGAIPRPAGTYMCQWIAQERARASQDYFVIYQYEWAADGVHLSPFGIQHVATIAARLNESPWPIVIEPTADEKLNVQRRTTILAALAQLQVAATPDRVVLGRPEAEGLYGAEAPVIASAILSQDVGAEVRGNPTGVFSPAQGSPLGTGAAIGRPAPAVGIGLY